MHPIFRSAAHAKSKPLRQPLDLPGEQQTAQEDPMTTLKILAAATAFVLMAGPAAAVTVKNNSAAEITIGVDWGSKEKVETIAAGKSVTVDCKEGCGISGPWGFSWKASGDDEITTDGVSLVTVMDGKKPE
jgi:hypothetical protein